MYKKSIFTNGSDYLKSSIQEIGNIYEEYDNSEDLTKKNLAGKYQEKEIQTIIDSFEKVRNPDIRITGYRQKLKYLLWIVLLLSVLPIPFLYSTYDLSPVIFSFTILIGMLPYVGSLVIFYSKYNTSYFVILLLYAVAFFIFSSDELIESIFEFTLEPIFLIFFSLYLILTISKIFVMLYSYKLFKMDDRLTRIVAENSKQ